MKMQKKIFKKKEDTYILDHSKGQRVIIIIENDNKFAPLPIADILRHPVKMEDQRKVLPDGTRVFMLYQPGVYTDGELAVLSIPVWEGSNED